ncbi:MAG: signal peptide peptidase SppA [Alphaproteobacteria bacterium]|nr:signal peptide peptidase SppA [Alphaproteobacteria bacterium]
MSDEKKIEKKMKKNWKRKLLINSFVYAFAIVGVFFFVFMFFIAKALLSDGKIVEPIPEKVILTLDMTQPYSELRVDDVFSEISGVGALSYYDLLRTISFAFDDDKVTSLVVDISSVNLGLSQIQNLRQTIKAFRSKGKKAYAYSTGFGAFGGGTGAYYLATAFDEIWMMPNTEIGITGLSIEVPFFKDLFTKIGVEPEFFSRYEYKNAMASMMSSSFSKEHKEELNKLSGGLMENIVQEISASRNMKVSEVTSSINEAPIFVKANFESKLIDKVAYKSELMDKLKKEHNAKAYSFVDYATYFSDIEDAEKLVAYMVLDGVINSGQSRAYPFDRENVIGSESVLQQLEEISENEKVKALVVRVNSPGGSYTASHEIWHALEKLKKDRQIPVVISMGDYAASGGYFIALAGDYVFAEPTTITGSVGVLGGKISLQKLWNKIGVNWGVVNVGDNAGALSLNRKFTEKEKKVFNQSLDNIYQDFVGKVANSRQIDLKKLDELARGRVWTGALAKEHHLIDDLGGMEASLLKARALIKEDGDKQGKYGLIYYPRKKTFQEKLSEFVGGGFSAQSSQTKINGVLFDLGIDIEDVNMLKRMKYDTILTPMKIFM